jgi:diguanylate cyclase (GGDEF)-like protein
VVVTFTGRPFKSGASSADPCGMENASRPRFERPLDDGLLAVAARTATSAATGESDPARAIDAAVASLHDSIRGVYPSVFVREHGRLWLIAQRGYPFVPDGIEIGRGVMGRAVRLDAPQLVADVDSDPDYLDVLPGMAGEIALPLRAGRAVIGVLNVDSERTLPDNAAALLQPLAAALGPLAAGLRDRRALDLSALARLFVYLGSLREPGEIATLAAASLSNVLDVDRSEVWTWDELGAGTHVASWSADDSDRTAFSASELEVARALVDSSAVCQLVEVGKAGGTGRAPRQLVWLPLRANGEELVVLVASRTSQEPVDAGRLDTAAVLAAHAAASLDSALALHRERRTALTDPLTGVLNRRGLEERLESELAVAQERRVPLSVVVLDCDDFKPINDRAGHPFGDALLRETADVLGSSLPEDGVAARIGGDEFVVVLPAAGPKAAEETTARICALLARGLTEAGFPLRMSAGIATYPFDGAGPTALLRAADQALYLAKDAGKDRIAAFRDVARPAGGGARAASSTGDERRAAARGSSILAEALAAVTTIEAEDTADAVCGRLAKALVFLVGATACSVSRVAGELLVDSVGHAVRDVQIGEHTAYRISDFPLTAEVLRTGESRTVSFLEAEAEVDPAEAFILRELGMNALLMVPLRVDGQPWGMVELYEMRLRRFADDEVAIAHFMTRQAERRLEALVPIAPPTGLTSVYELPSDAGRVGPPRTR